MSELRNRIAKALWQANGWHPDVFDSCVKRGAGDTGETQSMLDKVNKQTDAVFRELEDVICPECKGERRVNGHLCVRCNGDAQIRRHHLRPGEQAPFEEIST